MPAHSCSTSVDETQTPTSDPMRCDASSGLTPGWPIHSSRSFGCRSGPNDFYEPEDATWALLELGDSEAEPEIQAIAADRSDGLGLIAAIVAQALQGEEQVIEERLLRHDEHYLTKWIARAAALMSTPEMLRALALAVESLPDADCRETCAYWLELASSRDIRER